jgi:SanA protein
MDMTLFVRGLVYLIIGIFSFVVLCNMYVYIAGSRLIANDKAELEKSDAILVLGASVHTDGVLSPIFKERVDTAVELYRAGVAPKILVSGDNRDQNYNEVTPVLIYLTQENNIPPEDVFLDYAGLDTYDSMYRAKYIFQADSLVVVTQWFHLPRALFLAHAFGIRVEGIEARGGTKANVRLWVRERLATVKAVVDVVSRRESVHTGEQIPITGSGQASWGEE